MAYSVTERFGPGGPGTPPLGLQPAPGTYYTVEDPDGGVPWFRTITFYRAPSGAEVATDTHGEVLMNDGDLYRLVLTAVEEYDQAHP